MFDPALARTRAKFVIDAQVALRRPRAVLATNVVIAVLALVPLIPGGRSIAGVPFVVTACWAGSYIVSSTAACALFPRIGWTRAFQLVSAIETSIWLYGVIVLAALSGTLASPWLVLAFLGFIFLAGTAAFVDRGSVVVACGAPAVAAVAFAQHGLAVTAMAVVVVGLGLVAYLVLAASVERSLREQASREALQAHVALLERELERKHLARDLHDSIGSSLAVVSTYAELIERYLDSPDDLRRLSATLREVSRSSLDELRDLLEVMEPGDQTLGGLLDSLRSLARRATETVALTVSSSGSEQIPLEATVRLACVRVFQESVTNAIRHGHASMIRTNLDLVGDRLVLVVRDDGGGFEVAQPQAGRGIAGMRARADELGGTFAIESSPGLGTRLRFEIPCPPGATPAPPR